MNPQIILYSLAILLDIISWLLLLRTFMSMIDTENPIANFVYTVTEPVVAPVRTILNGTGMADKLPFDMSVFVTMLLIMIMEMFLGY